MKINKNLQFVIPVTRSDGTSIYVHSTPIDSACFRSFYRVLAKTFSVVMWDVGPMSGPRVADNVLEEVATADGIWESKPADPRTGTPAIIGVKQGLISEIQRRTHVIAAGERGWEPIPYHEAIQRGILEPDDVSEVASALVFFSAASHMFREREREMMMAALKHWAAQIESSNPTEFASSLPTSIAVASAGEKVVALSATRSTG